VLSPADVRVITRKPDE